jgi:diaminopropionate ammonia-lyase
MDLMIDEPLNWIENQRASLEEARAAVDRLLPSGISGEANAFHAQIPGYETTPLKSLSQLARRLGVGNIWVKDESARMGLNAFKALGGSFAIYRFICKKLDLPALSFLGLMSDDVRRRLGNLTFTSATDGNHGKGLAWAAQKLRFPCVIYVHKHTSQARIEGIAQYGAEVRVVDGNYDDAVRQCRRDAEANGWQIISDTSWPGYEEIPVWIMQGYSTLFAETQEQLSQHGVARPTHIFLQAGVGAFAAAAIAFYQKRFGAAAPTSLIVEPRTAGCLYHSVQIGDGQPHTIDGDLQTVMAGLACGEPSPVAWQVLRSCADYMATVPDYVAARGMRMYGVPLKGDPFVVSGESGAVTLGALAFIMRYDGAAALREQLGLNEQSQILLINTEGNTDPDYFRRIVWDGVLPVPEAYSLG